MKKLIVATLLAIPLAAQAMGDKQEPVKGIGFIECPPPPIEQAYSSANVVMRANVTNTSSTEISVAPVEVWKGNRSTLPTKLVLASYPGVKAKAEFIIGKSYLFFLTNEAGTYKTGICHIYIPTQTSDSISKNSYHYKALQFIAEKPSQRIE